jgi:hypothetical protein
MNSDIYGGWDSRAKRMEWIQEHCGVDGSSIPDNETALKYITWLEFNWRGKRKIKVQIHKDIKEQLNAALTEMQNVLTFDINYIGGYCGRYVSGTSSISNHTWGVAIDFNASYNGYIKSGWDVKYDEKQSFLKAEYQTNSSEIAKEYIKNGTFKQYNPNYQIVEILAKYGFGWGGSYTDYMHFSWFGGR